MFSTAGENVRRRVVRNCCVVKMKLLFVVVVGLKKKYYSIGFAPDSSFTAMGSFA